MEYDYGASLWTGKRKGVWSVVEVVMPIFARIYAYGKIY